MKQVIIYKDIEFIKDDDLNTIEYTANNKNLTNTEDYIRLMTIISEYAEYKRPDYILINKRSSNFVLTKNLLNYTKEIIFHQLRAWGVKKILIIVDDELFEKFYKKMGDSEPLLKGFISVEEAYEWISYDENRFA